MSFRSVLVAYDGSGPSRAALAEAVALAKNTGAVLRVASVVPIVAGVYGVELPPGTSVESTIDRTRKMLDELGSRLQQEGGLAKVETLLLQGDPVDQVLDEAEKHPPDLLVVGSRGLSGPGRFFLGSVSDGLVHHAHCSVLVVRPPATGAKP